MESPFYELNAKQQLRIDGRTTSPNRRATATGPWVENPEYGATRPVLRQYDGYVAVATEFVKADGSCSGLTDYAQFVFEDNPMLVAMSRRLAFSEFMRRICRGRSA